MSINDVSTEIRRQLGLHNSAPFNLKYLDVEGILVQVFDKSINLFV